MEAVLFAWQKLGPQRACRGEDPEVFFPATQEEAQAAKAICQGCVKREECLNLALESGETEGIWGGTTEGERRRLLNRRHLKRQYGAV